jgi:hypothetical protein
MRIQAIATFALAALQIGASPPQGTTPPEIGHLPVLDPLPASGKCETTPLPPDAQKLGAVRAIALLDKPGNRRIMVGVDANNRALNLIASASTQAGTRGELENVTIGYRANGTIFSGRRNYATTGTPASTKDDRHSSLLPGDSARAQKLIVALIQKCGR